MVAFLCLYFNYIYSLRRVIGEDWCACRAEGLFFIKLSEVTNDRKHNDSINYTFR